MLTKNEMIYSESMGVCRVEEITKLAVGKEMPTLYYVLRSQAHREKIAYIPAEHHQVLLREVITEEEAKRLLTETPELLQKEQLRLEEVAFVLKQPIDRILESLNDRETDQVLDEELNQELISA